MNILFASSEVAPFSKTGGLADVAGALPGALAALGNNVRVITPKYKTLSRPVGQAFSKITVQIGNKKETAGLFESKLPAGSGGAEIPIIFVGNDKYFARDQLYTTAEGDYPDNYLRFSFFGRAILETAKSMKFKPDVLHVNDWQCAMAAVYLRVLLDKDPFFKDTKILFTIHNLGYQGHYKPEILEEIGLPKSVFKMESLEYYGKVNLLKGGIVYSDAINTVSQKYAQEIQTPEYGMGLEGALKHRSDRLFGIVNGVDYAAWSPETDKLIDANYSSKNTAPKEICKKDLLAQFGLPYVQNKPLIGMISRLDRQKGFDLIETALPDLMIRDLQLVILGTGDKRFHDFFDSVKSKYPTKLGVKLAYDNAIAHKIEAGCDMFLMPSLYEPCGLNQMYSMKYGAVPVVRGTGGLDDTICEWDGYGAGNGFKFYDYDYRKMLESIDRALKTYLDKKAWAKIVSNGMAEDHSWAASARKYVELYNKLRN